MQPRQRLNHPHPGDTLVDQVIAPSGLSIGEFAANLDVPAASLELVASGRSGITEELAQKLEASGFSTARLWLAMQAEYDLSKRPKPPTSA